MLSVYALAGGFLEIDRSFFFPDTEPGTRLTAPVPCWLVVHPRGRLLFDTGVHRDARVDPVARLGEQRASRFQVRSGPHDDVVSQLGLLGLGPDDLTYVVNSHLHFDHCGGNEFFPGSTFLVQSREMEAARTFAAGTGGRYTPSVKDFDHPLEYQLVDGEHDVWGDGQVVLLPTYGHTPGHQSLWLRPGKGRSTVFTADACYTCENMDRDVLPGAVWDEKEMSGSLASLRALRDTKGAFLVYGHDPDQWHGFRRAPEPLAVP